MRPEALPLQKSDVKPRSKLQLLIACSMALFADCDDKDIEELTQLLGVTQTEIAALPVKPEARALDDVREVASRIVVHESSDCWHDAYVKLLIAGKLYRLLVEFKPCLPIKGLGWLSSVVTCLKLVDIHCKDQGRVLGPDFYDVPRAKRPDGASQLIGWMGVHTSAYGYRCLDGSIIPSKHRPR